MAKTRTGGTAVRSTLVLHATRGQNWGPGQEPQSVRDAWDKHLETRQQAEADGTSGSAAAAG
jgi:hypothetical protein